MVSYVLKIVTGFAAGAVAVLGQLARLKDYL